MLKNTVLEQVHDIRSMIKQYDVLKSRRIFTGSLRPGFYGLGPRSFKGHPSRTKK